MLLKQDLVRFRKGTLTLTTQFFILVVNSTGANWLMSVRYFTKIGDIPEIPQEEKNLLEEVQKRFSFRVNDYYLSLIDWNDPSDPIRRIIIPDYEELNDGGALDASNESTNYVAPGCQHKYPRTTSIIERDCSAGSLHKTAQVSFSAIPRLLFHRPDPPPMIPPEQIS